ncbi:membrane protein [Streptomyces purpurascens]|nr:membrane protein [Streptomyces purpurascens]
MRAERAERAPGAQRRTAPVRRTAPASAAPGAGRLPNPRLTGLGSGLFCGLVMFLLGSLCAALFGTSLTAYGVLFLPVCVLTAVWVRRGDLMIAPVVVPIAFAVGLLPVADGDGGAGGRLMGVVTALATQAGWLYGGTLVAGLIVIVRRIRLVHRRRATAAAEPRPPV